jgi:peptidyl-prolyl cis-trans isomerase SurA
MTPAKVLEDKKIEMEKTDPNLANLIREYHDGLLLYEMCNRTVWDKAAKDEAGLENFFNKNKKKYRWEQPRFKGIAYHVKDNADVKAVKNAVKNQPFDKWAEILRKTFNNDSILRIRVEKGYFKMGDNALVDKEVFKKDTTVTPMKDYPIDAVYGKKLKAPKEMEDVRAQVVADYQDSLEKEWVATLRKKYPVTVNKEVLATVNKH